MLLTSKKLRSGLHDPKSLLNLARPSINALDRTKSLELVTGAGWNFSSNSSGSSFYDKLNAAELRFNLGLGGHSMRDTQLFGAKAEPSWILIKKQNLSG